MADKRELTIDVTPPRARTGRPSSYTEETADRIIQLIEEGHSVRAIAQMVDMPAWDTIRKWLRDRPDFLARHAAARETAADAMEAEILDRVMSITTPQEAQIAQVQINALKWLMERRAPKRYGAQAIQSDAAAPVIRVDGGLPD